MGLAVLAPAAFVLSPTGMNFPVDVLLGVLLPVHSHIGLNIIVSDYVPKSTRPAARALVLAVSVIAAAGLLKLNLQGAGLTESVKSLWRKKADKK